MAESGVNVKDKVKMFQDNCKPKQPQSKVAAQLTGASRDRLQRRNDHSKKNDGALFKEPAKLIFTDEETGKLRCDEKTVQMLSEIMQPLNVVAITGLYRTGKSYLLNRLAGKKGGFKTGHKTHACTKGIWIWCRHHPTKDDQVLVLLDVEGFGDLEKVNRNEDTWLFTLATVLSSTLVFNNKGTLDAYALDRLKFLEQIDTTIEVSQDDEDKRFLDFDFFFPSFVVTLRDFGLEMVNRFDQPVMPDEYLEDLLIQKRGTGEDVEQYNKIRLLIRRYFKKRKCFAFITPCGPKAKLEKLADRDIEPDFLKSVEEFCNYIFERKPLQLKSGRGINGRMFANLAMHYVNAMGQNKPSILEATKHMVQTENQAIVVAASEIYKTEMQQCLAKMGDTVTTDDALVNFHELCLSKALANFKELIVFDDEDIFQTKTMNACKTLLSQFKRICDANSIATCQAVIERLNKRVEKKLKAKTYCCASGYDEYMQDINWIVRKYTSMTGLGSQSRKILQAYLDSKEGEEERVYQMVVDTQKGKTQLSTVQERTSSKTTDLSKSFSRSETLHHSLKTKVECMESDIRTALSEQHNKEKKAIQDEYNENLNLKIKELKRQRSEEVNQKEALIKLERQIEDLSKVYEYIKKMNEHTKDAALDIDVKEESRDQRPTTIGASQENLNEETAKVDDKAKKKKWCSMQ